MTGTYTLTKRIRHGFAKRGAQHPIYNSWVGMRQRCLNPRNKEYAHYGGRGITICARWRDDFLTFMADMGERPAGTSLDRIDNDRGYEPGNVRWAPQMVQNRNQRRTRLTDRQVAAIRSLAADGYAKKQLARQFSVAPKTIRQILAGQTWA